MTSIIKVDQIQLTDGNAPTAADLGFAAGSVLQVVNASDATQTRTTTVSSDVDLTLSATITPTSSSSKVLVSIHAFVAENPNGGVYLKRGSTKIGGAGGTAGANNDPDNFYNADDLSYNAYTGGIVVFQYLDSPATTSATTYKIGYRSNGSSAQFCYNRTQSVTDSRLRSTITLFEISG